MHNTVRPMCIVCGRTGSSYVTIRRLSVCPSVRLPTAAACGGFAAVGPYAARRLAANASSVVYLQRRRKPGTTDLSCLRGRWGSRWIVSELATGWTAGSGRCCGAPRRLRPTNRTSETSIWSPNRTSSETVRWRKCWRKISTSRER